MPLKHVLSKSTFMYGCQCPKRLYLHKFRPELRNPEDEKHESIFASGTDVGLLARGIFPGGVNAEPPDSFSYHIAVEKTAKYISQQHSVIYEAAFNFEGVMCAIDILVKKKNRWHAFEVKSNTSVKEPVIMDASLQHYVITRTELPLEDFSIVFLNNQYVRKGNLEVHRLFKEESVIERASAYKNFVEQKISELKKLLAEKKEPHIEIGDHCYSPYDCDFTNHCGADVTPTLPDGKKHVDKKAIWEFLNTLEYPLFFMDFETVMPAVPEFDNSRPYQQIPFQYSVHIQKSVKGETEHFEFLGDGIHDPRNEFIKSLLSKLGTKGSIITWNKTFEITRLRELSRDYPEFGKKITGILGRIEDLMIVFKRGWYWLPEFYNSASLKLVLPAMVPELTYENLEIQEGGMASLVYAQLKKQSTGIREQHIENLKEYCKRDTLAMVRIWEKLNEI